MMPEDLRKFPYVEDEIDLREIIKLIIDFKKIIISTIIIFTIVGIIVSSTLTPSFKTKTLLEIGHIDKVNGDRKLIESSSDFISDLNIQMIKNNDNFFTQPVSMKSIEGKLIEFETTSTSVEQNEYFLSELVKYIDKRHSDIANILTKQEKSIILMRIESIETELDYVKSKLSDQNQGELIKIIVELNQKLSNLFFTLNSINNQTITKTSLVMDLETMKITKTKLILVFSLIIGLITGVFLAFARNLKKSNKGS